MSAIPTSLVVVSRDRPAALLRCLVGISQLDHPCFEVIVVADPEGLAMARMLDRPIKYIAFDQANISAARNAGIAAAAGRVVAFIDDDAVPEPTWLSRLTAPFADPSVVASTGYVRGPNGISFQWTGMEIDYLGEDHSLATSGKVEIRTGSRQRAVKTQGTNCAFRREVLARIGGFDPAFPFYHDETDLNLRMAELGLTAIVPNAEVHHGYEASERRTATRLPLTLHDIGASTAVFLRKHAPPDHWDWQQGSLISVQKERLERFREEGRITAHERLRLLETLAAGWNDGAARAIVPLTMINPATTPFQQMPETPSRPGVVLTGRFWQMKSLRKQALELVEQHCIVTVICLSPTFKPHRMQFQPQGFWLLTGGIFGRSAIEADTFQLKTFGRCIRSETERLGSLRPVG